MVVGCEIYLLLLNAGSQKFFVSRLAITISIPQTTAYFSPYSAFVSGKAYPIGHYCPLTVKMHLLLMKMQKVVDGEIQHIQRPD